MKKIILIFITFILTIYSVFADVKLNFYSDKTEYNIEDRIKLKINLSTDENSISQLNIKGLDNFQVIGQNQIENSHNINGIKSSNFLLNLTVLAKKSGDFTLGPVSIKSGTGIIESKKINIKVTGERIMVNNAINNEEDEEKEDNLDKLDNINLGGEKKEEYKKKKILDLDGKEMKDIYPEKKFLIGNIFHKDSIYLVLFFVIVLVILFLLKKYTTYFLNKKDKIIKKYNRKKYIIKKKINYNKLLISIEEEYLDSKKELFYAKLGDLFRLYLDDKIFEGLSRKSLSEFKNKKIPGLIDDKKEIIIKIYEKIYYPEYNISGDEKEVRREIIEEVKNVITD